MKKIIKISIILLVVLVSGCSNKELQKYYKNMQFDKIDSYTLDLRIYGTYKNAKINEIVRISNYKDEQLRINSTPDMEKIYGEEKRNERQERLLVLDNNKLYKFDEEKKEYVETGNILVYKETDTYLESIKELKKVKKTENKTIGNTEYEVFEVTFKDENIKNLISKTNVSELEVKDVTGFVYINNNNVHKIEIKFETLTISASYFGINGTTKIRLN